MSFPNFDGKHDLEAFFSPREAIDYLRRDGGPFDFEPPSGAIFCYQRTVVDHALATHPHRRVEVSIGDFYLLEDFGIGLARPGIGAPVAAIVLEDLIALGVTDFLSIGTAGSLQSARKIGDVVICSAAIRDEGVSHHYLASTEAATPSKRLCSALEDTLRSRGVDFTRAPSWTIDAPYRETAAEARHYQQQGVATVEMEAAALFAVASYRGVDLASAFVVSDSLADLEWNPQFRAPETSASLEVLFDAAFDSLKSESAASTN